MTDERYTFIEDVKDKKRTAVGSHNKRTHAGKGGAIKFPSDYLSKKEIRKMNGECKTYRLNDPMTYGEFKQMPKDIQKQYLLALIAKFDMSNKALAETFGCAPSVICRLFADFEIPRGQRRNSEESIRKDTAFELWWRHGCLLPESESKVVDVSGVIDSEGKYITDSDNGESNDHKDPVGERWDGVVALNDGTISIVEGVIMPESLSMTLHGSPWQIYRMLESIYGKNKIRIDISVSHVE